MVNKIVKPNDAFPVIPTVGVVVLQNNEVLLVRHGGKAGHIKDTLGIPAGRIEVGENETPREAAKRELEEETGYHVTIESLQEFENNHLLVHSINHPSLLSAYPYYKSWCRSQSHNQEKYEDCSIQFQFSHFLEQI